ncbi:MAG: hypothetical protein JW746_08780 [Candidatus Krumholzibacteriota bacterium]|nr:hypothetical protein [Candidatus Krumholzibacteriota bacterium]
MIRMAGNKAKLRLRRFLTVLVCICILVAAAYVTGEWYRRRDYRDRFGAMRGTLTHAEGAVERLHKGDLFQSVYLRSDRGITVSASLKVPAGEERRYPALVILEGLVTGRQVLDYLEDTNGIILLALDYPYGGKKKKLSALEFTGSLPRIHRAVLETVPSVMLGIDYLLSRDDVMPDRIILVGGSLGAIFVPAAMAADGRIAAGAILFGAGDIERLVRSDLDLPSLVAAPAGWACAVLTSSIEPLKYVADISPRPLFMMNGSADPRIPERCSRIIHETAQEPKTVVWLDAGHLDVRSREFHEIVIRELLEWLISRGLIESDQERDGTQQERDPGMITTVLKIR